MSLGEVAVMERRLAALGHIVVDYDRYNDQRRRLELLEAIVSDLANSEPMAPVESEYGIEQWVCALCEVHTMNVRRAPFHDEWEPIDHPDSCPWQRAREAIGAEA